jgi:chromosome segregation ATPase
VSEQQPGHFEAPEPHHTDTPPHAAYVPATTPSPASLARRRGRIAVVVTLSVLLAASLTLAGYLWYAAAAWRSGADAWEAQARAQGESVADLQARLDATSQELASTRDQLTSATARITQLADEKAQLGDENAASGQYLDYQRRVSEAAGVVARALDRCTQGQAQLITYLRAPDQYDAADVERFRRDVQSLCQQASDANTQLQQELDQ